MLLLGRARAFSHSDLATCRQVFLPFILNSLQLLAQGDLRTLQLNMNQKFQVLGHCYLGDWFVLYQLCKNSNSYFFRYLLRSLEKSFNAKVTTLQLILITEWT